ncbi:MAG TPA: hypothetical protein VHE82_04550 [Gemmatimonadaceae bacterium]|nr:hypothetical protein [Gemmatimonadaceae bacterium]
MTVALMMHPERVSHVNETLLTSSFTWTPAALEGLDAVAFTGGIGEHSASMRSRICRRLEFLGLRLEDERNRAVNGRAAMQISVEGNEVQVWVIPTDEEREIAWSTYEQFS